jgi:hypothetical protein
MNPAMRWTSRLPVVAAWARGLSIIAAILWGVDILTRPPCPEGYVRLLDIELAMPVVALVVGAVAWALIASARRGNEHGREPTRSAMVVGVVALVFGGLLIVSAATTIASHQAPLDGACWTF